MDNGVATVLCVLPARSYLREMRAGRYWYENRLNPESRCYNAAATIDSCRRKFPRTYFPLAILQFVEGRPCG